MKNFGKHPLYTAKRPKSSSTKAFVMDDGSRIQSQARLVMLVALSVFICEASVMVVISFLPTWPVWLHALFDATLLVILLIPVLYFCLFRTLVHHIDRRRQVEEELRNHRDQLDKLVTERTTELTATNQNLKKEISDRQKVEEELKHELAINSALSKLYEPLISPSASIEDIAFTVLDKAKILTRSEHGYVSSIDPAT